MAPEWKTEDYLYAVTADAPADTSGNGQMVAQAQNSGSVFLPMAGSVPVVTFGGVTWEMKNTHSKSGTWDVNFGTDDPAVNPYSIVVTRAGHAPVTFSLIVGDPLDLDIDGVHYGIFQLFDNKSFTFTSDNCPPGQLQIELFATDDDGDTNKGGVLTLDIANQESGLNIPYLAPTAGVDEANLPDGSFPAPTECVRDIPIPPNVKVDTTGWTDKGNGIWELNPDPKYAPDGTPLSGFGTLTYDDTTNTLTYTLTDAVKNLPGTDEVTDVLTITLTDGVRSEPIDVLVTIEDDAPSITFTPDAPPDPTGYPCGDPIEGVWTNIPGADGVDPDKGITVIYTDKDGNTHEVPVKLNEPTDLPIPGLNPGDVTVTINDDGTFSIDTKPNSLKPGDPDVVLDLVVKITDTDGDSGDTSGTPISLTVYPPFEILPLEGTVSEAGLSGNPQKTGSAETDIPLAQYFYVDTTAPVDGHVWQKGSGDVYTANLGHGILTYDATDANNPTLKYTLSQAQTHADPLQHGAQDTVDIVFDITLKDHRGNTGAVQTTITVEDDQPLLYVEGAGWGTDIPITSGYPFSANWGMDFGADGPGTKGIFTKVTTPAGTAEIALPINSAVDIIVGGQNYGKFMLVSSPTEVRYYFHPVGNLDANVKLDFFIQDGDGDTSSAGGSLSFLVTPPPSPIPPFLLAPVSEAFLENGTHLPADGSTVQYFKMPANVVVDVSEWVPPSVSGDPNGVYMKAGTYGVLFYNPADNSMTYALVAPASHGDPNASGNADIMYDPVPVTLKDAFGNTWTLPVEVKIADDAPAITFISGGNDNTLGDPLMDFTSQGVLDIKFGADGYDGPATVLPVTFTSTYTNAVNGSVHSSLPVAMAIPKDGTSVVYDTMLGKLTLSYDAATQKVNYHFIALRGHENDKEAFSFTATDKDGDKATATMTLGLQTDVPTLIVDEAGLPFGSQAPGHGDSEDSGSISTPMDPISATDIIWDIANISPIKADGNQDGTYTNVTWSVSGKHLQGFADGELVIEIAPVFTAGIFSGEVTATIFKPFQHSLINDANDFLNLRVPFIHKDAAGTSTKDSLSVAIKDDMPFGNTPNGTPNVTKMEVMEGGSRQDDVYLVVDASGSIDDAEMVSQIQAIRSLVEAYQTNGIDCRFTLISFGTNASRVFDGASADYILSHLPANQTGINTVLSGITERWTNYNAGLGKAQEELDAALNDPGTRFMNKVLYFLSDGEPNKPDGSYNDYRTTWGNYLQKHPEVDVFSVGVDMPEDGGIHLWHVAGKDASKVFYANDFDGLGQVLVDLVDPVMGNILHAFASADTTHLDEVIFGKGANAKHYLLDYNGDPSGLKNTGDIVLTTPDGRKITIRIFDNGEFKLMTDNLDDDFHIPLFLRVKDADGDTSLSHEIDFVVKDYVPVAYDNLAKFTPVDNYHYSGNVLTDPSPTGDVDSLHDQARLYSVTYNGVEHTFVQFSLNINTSTGTLTINQFGDYTFKAFNNNYTAVNEEFSYKLRDVDGDTDSAVLHVKWNSTLPYDNIGTERAASGTTIVSDFSSTNEWSSLVDNGWQISGMNGVRTGEGTPGYATLPVNPYLGSMPATDNMHLMDCFAEYFDINSDKQMFTTFFGTDVQANVLKILQNTVGIQGTARDFQSGAGANGMDIMLAQKEFHSSGGKIAFSWSSYVAMGERDATFWMLKDAHGSIVKAGKFQQGGGSTSGLLELDIPAGGDYTLVLGTINIGTGYGADPHLIIGPIVSPDAGVGFMGNVITDPSLEGYFDIVHSNTHLASVTYGTLTKSFSSTVHELNFDTPTGKLVIDWDGNYRFYNNPGVSVKNVAEKFTYTLTDSEPGKSAVLYLQTTGPIAQDNLAEQDAGFASVRSLGTFDAPLNSVPWYTSGQISGAVVTSNAALGTYYLPPPSSDVLTRFSDGKYLDLSQVGSFNSSASQNIFGTNMGIAAFMTQTGFDHAPYNSNGTYYGAFASTNFTTKGGQIVFDWSFGGNEGVSPLSRVDGALWILKDANGNLIKSGVLAEIEGSRYLYKANTAIIDIDLTATAQNYTLTIGMMELANTSYNNSYDNRNAHLYIGTVAIQEDPYNFHGNMLTDPAPDGAIDHLAYDAKLFSITYNGTEYYFLPGSDTLTINCPNSATMEVHQDGSYFYTNAPGSTADNRVVENFLYTVRNPDGSNDHGDLFIRSDRYVIEGTGEADIIDRSHYGTPDVISAGGGNDHIITGAGPNAVFGGEGNDTIKCASGNDTVFGGKGDDLIHGGAGNDVLHGNAGNDIIYGEAGNDLIYGGSGNNTLYGGTGADTFAWRDDFANGKDFIKDFLTTDMDKLSFKDLLDPTENTAQYLNAHVSGLSLNEAARTLSFNITEGVFTKAVDVTFQSSDTGFDQMVHNYEAATNTQQELSVLNNFLLTISS